METQTQKKKCSQCQYDLPIYSFGLNCSSPDGYNYICKSCRNIKRKYDYKNNSVDLNQLPQRSRNEEILKTINEDVIFQTECGHSVNVSFSEKETLVRILKGSELILGLDIWGIDIPHLRNTLYYHLEQMNMTLIYSDH